MAHIVTKVLICARGQQKRSLEKCKMRRICLAVAAYDDGKIYKGYEPRYVGGQL